jgi:succinyl-CoA synthetase beta subunit
VKAIFINVFGGILRVDAWPRASSLPCASSASRCPSCCAQKGTNVEQGKKMLADSGLPLIMAADMAEGAKKAVELAGRGRS